MSNSIRVTDLIRADHAQFRAGFAALSDADTSELQSQWAALAASLEVHAAAEESTFYPRLLADDADANDETKDAIKDHNEIRDAIRAADSAAVGDTAWWTAVRAAEKANADHMKEEEDGPLPDFETHADHAAQTEAAQQFAEYKAQHPRGRGIDTSDRDPVAYVDEQLHGSKN